MANDSGQSVEQQAPDDRDSVGIPMRDAPLVEWALKFAADNGLGRWPHFNAQAHERLHELADVFAKAAR